MSQTTSSRILVTGGSRGLGLAICTRLLTEGQEVFTLARSISAEVQKLAASFPGRLHFHPVDLADREAVDGYVKQHPWLMDLDGLVANAALGTDGLLLMTPDAALRKCIEVNLTSTVVLTKTILKGMLQRGGNLVFISSIAAKTALKGLSVYSATKAGLAAFCRTIAKEYGERGIRANCILPGFLDTEMSHGLNDHQRQQIIRRTALRRLGEGDDICGVVSFLLSPAARFITGAEIVVDGGFSI